MVRRDWEDLPPHIRNAVYGKCGTVAKAESVPTGTNSDLAVTLHTTDDVRVFCKGIATDSPRVRMHRHEASINPWLPHSLAPRLLWQIEMDGWLLLGFEYITGQHANLSPGSPHLPLVADTVSVLARELTPCPADNVARLAEQWGRIAAWRRLAHNAPKDLHPWSRQNIDRLVGWESRALELVDGNSLLHTDLNPLNILVCDTAHLVDWAWSREGAVWVDAGFLIIRLIAAGHTPEQAEQWADDIPAWREASETARTAFAVAVTGIWEHLQHLDPLPHRAALTNTARTWAQHRLHDQA